MARPKPAVAPDHEETNYGRLTSRNTILTLILFVSPFLLLYLAVNHEVASLIKGQVYSRLAETTAENVKTIRIFLQDRETDIRSVSHFDVDRIEDVGGLAPFLKLLLDEKKWYDFLLIADLDGRIILSINKDLSGQIADREYFRAARAGRFYNSGIFFSELVKDTVLILAHPLLNRHGRAIGVVAAALDLKSFYGLLFSLQLGKTSELFLVDGRGTLLSPTKLGGRPLVGRSFPEGEANPHQGPSGVKTHVDYRGQKVLCAYAQLDGSEEYLVSEMDLEEALLPVRQVNRIILYLFLPFFLLLVGVSNLNARRTTSLLRGLTVNLRRALADARAKTTEVDAKNVEIARKAKESERLAEELRLSEEYIVNLVDSISLGVIGLDSSGKITLFNKEIRHLFDLPDLQRGQDVFRTLPWMKDADIELGINDSVLENRPHRVEKKKIDRGKGEEFFNLSFFPVEDGRGKIVGVSILVEDVTERETLNRQLAEYEKLSALSQLALGAAHEINNPLLGISSYLEILREQAQREADRREIDIVLENVYRISQTIRGLLNFARPTPPHFTKVSLNHLVDETLTFLSHQPIFRNVRIGKELPPSVPQITADLNQVRQVLTNIFINAAQSMPAGGELRVETSKVKFKELVQVDISDTGIGIPPENLTKIFNPFFTTKKNVGTGLGLSISLSYVKNHNGDIQVRSVVSRGTTFSIVFPIRQEGKTAGREEEVVP